MRYLIILVASLMLSIMSLGSLAKPVNLYAKPAKDAKVVTTVDPWSRRLIPIFRQGDWLKVGDRHTGTVGWLNIPEYHKTIAEDYKPMLRTIYVQKTKANGKEQITAYVNGKKVDQKQQQLSTKEFTKMQRRMGRMMHRMMRDVDDSFNWFAPMPIFPRFPYFEPIVIVVKSTS